MLQCEINNSLIALPPHFASICMQFRFVIRVANTAMMLFTLLESHNLQFAIEQSRISRIEIQPHRREKKPHTVLCGPLAKYMHMHMQLAETRELDMPELVTSAHWLDKIYIRWYVNFSDTFITSAPSISIDEVPSDVANPFGKVIMLLCFSAIQILSLKSWTPW